jgi:hypothetical protein
MLETVLGTHIIIISAPTPNQRKDGFHRLSV